ncbi:hypothetical protein MCC93_04220 [Morococcus cerebrosus]|uniref:Uncharacterized protein n=1 Tax=Morococcus cerebrosus TaxID=1056807 RepID=A0A0C1ETR6_9NEIS|nr:hypothetical protein MCC93_04220 [Morococcus cerebrosus]
MFFRYWQLGMDTQAEICRIIFFQTTFNLAPMIMMSKYRLPL